MRSGLAALPTWRFLAAALVLRLAFALWAGDAYVQVDEFGFSEMARNIARFGVFGTGDKPQAGSPIPAFFFSLLMRWKDSLLWPRLAQAVVGAAGVWLIGRMTAEFCGPVAGRLALMIAAVYPFFIYYSGLLMSETLYVFFVTAGLWALASLFTQKERWRAPAAGFSLAAAALCRPEALPISLLLWAAAAALAIKRARGRFLGTAFLCWLALLGGWLSRTRLLAGTWALDTHGGMTMLHGTVAFELNEIDTSLTVPYLKSLPFWSEAQTLGEVERDRRYMREAFRFMAGNPAATLKQWVRKFLNFWRFYPRRDKQYHDNPYNRPDLGLGRAALIGASLLFEPWLIVLGAWGLLSFDKRKEAVRLFGLFILGTMLMHVVSVSQMRYRLAAMPFLILGASSFLAGRLQSVKR